MEPIPYYNSFSHLSSLETKYKLQSWLIFMYYSIMMNGRQGYIKHSDETHKSIDHLETGYEDIGRILSSGNVTYKKNRLLKEDV